MKPVMTKFNDKIGDVEITIPVPFTLKDGIEYANMMAADIPKYEDTKDYNVFDLIRENQELKEQIEYLKGGEYLNQLRFERDMLQHVVDNSKVSKVDKEFIDMTHRNTKLLEEKQKYKEVIDKLSKTIYEIDELRKTTGGYPSDYIDYSLEILREVE